jgi:hypothetical protein
MTAPDRAYDSKRRPNTFYKSDEASNAELAKRAYDRGQYKSISPLDSVSGQIGHAAGGGTDISPKVERGGKSLSNITLETKDGNYVHGGTSINMPISGTTLGKSKGQAQGK